MCSYHLNLRFATVVIRSSYGPIACNLWPPSVILGCFSWTFQISRPTSSSDQSDYIRTICFHNPTGLVHDAERCSQFYDCSATYDNPTITASGTESAVSAAGPGSLSSMASAGNLDAGSTSASGVAPRTPSAEGGQAELMEYLLECPYPSLFSKQTGSCQDHRAVSCGEREEPKAPCKSCILFHR